MWFSDPMKRLPGPCSANRMATTIETVKQREMSVTSATQMRGGGECADPRGVRLHAPACTSPINPSYTLLATSRSRRVIDAIQSEVNCWWTCTISPAGERAHTGSEARFFFLTAQGKVLILVEVRKSSCSIRSLSLLVYLRSCSITGCPTEQSRSILWMNWWWSEQQDAV